MDVSPENLFALIGEQHVEILMLRTKLAQIEALMKPAPAEEPKPPEVATPT